MLRPGLKRLVRFSIVVAVVLGVYVLFGAGYVTVVNADLRGRLIEVDTASGVGASTTSDDLPVVRLVLHRWLVDENAVEASIVISTINDPSSAVKDGKTRYTAMVRDGSSYQPYGLEHDVTLDQETARASSGQNALAVQSERFTLPALPSVIGFPFDDLTVRPIVDLYENGSNTSRFHLEVQKALPGRLMSLSKGNIVEVRLTRSPTEKALVLASSLVFLLLSAILSVAIFRNARGLTTLEELLAVGGYLVAAAGFRDVLGVSRVAGTSALEIAVIGIPVLLLTTGVAVSAVRGGLHLRAAKREEPSDASVHPT